MNDSYELAQVNIAALREPLDSPLLAGFVAALEPVNALADAAPGFRWRLQTEDGDATGIRAFDDDMLIVNLSVWESVEALAAFVYSGEHLEVMRSRRTWFHHFQGAYQALWWVPAGHRPDPDEAADRLESLRRHGPTPTAFTFKVRFPSPSGASTHDAADDRWFCPA